MEPTAEAPVTEVIVDSPVDGSTDTLVEDELLVEEISIDGMCGVY